MKKLLCLLLILSTCIICSCSEDAEAKYQDLMENITPSNVSPIENIEDENKAYTEFAVNLFKKSLSENGKNTLISPLSVIYALGLTANGADGNTLAQMEAVLGFPIDDLNNYLYSYAKQKAQNDAATLSIANSIWFTNDEERLSVNNEFLQKNADYYNAAANRADFSDPDTIKDINNWVKENTKGMIPEIIDAIKPNDVMFLVNALAFEAEWKDKYTKRSVKEGTFTNKDGTQTTVEFMHSDEYRYIGDENCKGFMKDYKGNYAFAALLPNENISIDEFVSTLSGEKITNMLTTLSSRYCITSMPKFETEYNIEMAEIFKSLGMTDAFIEGVADFSKMADPKGIFIGNIIHKTFISVGEKGTKAGAATVVEMNDGGMFSTETTEIHLNRPFVYMLIDTENNIPLFMGTLMSVK